MDVPDNNHTKRIAISRNSSNEDRSSKKSTWSDDSGHSTSTVHLSQKNTMGTNASSSKKNPNAAKPYNWKEMPTDAVLKIERPHFRLPHKPSLLKKLSDSSYVMPEEQPHPSPQQYTGEELRSQLPWSYFGTPSRTDPVIKPKKSFVELRDDEDLPPVPVPDYTIKFSQRDQQTLNVGERRPMPAKKFINPKRGAPNDRIRKCKSLVLLFLDYYFVCSRVFLTKCYLLLFAEWSGPEYRY